MRAQRQYCTFYLDKLLFGIDVQSVQEVLLYQEMTRVPLAPPIIRGLVNLRGQIVTALDLRQRMGLPGPPPSSRPPMNVVVRTSDGAVSLLVDDIGDVIEVANESLEAPPDTLDGISRELVDGVVKLKGKLLMILSTERAIHISPEAGEVSAHA